MRDRAQALSSRATWPGTGEVLRLRRAASGEAEGEADVRPAGDPIPRLLPPRLGREREDRRESVATARAASGQRRFPDGLLRYAGGESPARSPRPFPGERQAREHPLILRPAGKHGASGGEEPKDAAHRRGDGDGGSARDSSMVGG